MIASPHHPDGLDMAMLERILSVGGAAIRPALVAQLIADLDRLARALGDDAVQTEGEGLARAAHELKGLAATIGATGLAETAARFDALAPSLTPAMRAAMALGLRRQIDAVCAVLRAQAPSAA